MALPSNASPINTSDTISDTIKTTTGYFTNGDGTLEGTTVYANSASLTNDKYYFNVYQLEPSASSAEVQFSVTFGHIAGSGSDCYGDSTDNPNTLFGQTQAIYGQLSNILQHENDISGGFMISQQGSNGKKSTGQPDDYVYALIAKRSKFKDRVNKKNWTLTLSGSNTRGSGSSLMLTDDSKDQPATSTPAGPRYNIVEGQLGEVTTAYSDKTYGWFYPERGVMLFSGIELSGSLPGTSTIGIPLGATEVSASYDSLYFSSSNAGTSFSNLNAGDKFLWQSSSINLCEDAACYASNSFEAFVTYVTAGGKSFTASKEFNLSEDAAEHITGSILYGRKTEHSTASFALDNQTIHSSSGFAPNLYAGAGSNPKNALRLINCMRLCAETASLRMRSEEDKTEENYFCRIKATEYNFSNNPTWVSGSKNKIRNTGMFGNPQTYITGVGLYNSAGQLLAIASLSKPLTKNFASEATIKVRLTY